MVTQLRSKTHRTKKRVDLHGHNFRETGKWEQTLRSAGPGEKKNKGTAKQRQNPATSSKKDVLERAKYDILWDKEGKSWERIQGRRVEANFVQ